MNTNIDFSNYEVDVPNTATVQGQALVSRQSSEVEGMVFMAKRFPRNENASLTKIMRSCSRMKLAESAMYEYPRGTTKVTGPSIRLAEAIATSWGNIDYGFYELSRNNGGSSCFAYAWDLESNVKRSITFEVKHVRNTKSGSYPVTDERDIYELVANQAMRRVRNCILGVVPGDVTELAIEKCKHTLTSGNKEPLNDRIRKMIITFDEEFKVNIPMLEEYIGCRSDAFSENDFVRLKSVYRSLRDGVGKREEFFNLDAGVKKTSSDLDDLNEELKKPNKEEKPTEKSKKTSKPDRAEQVGLNVDDGLDGSPEPEV